MVTPCIPAPTVPKPHLVHPSAAGLVWSATARPRWSGANRRNQPAAAPPSPPTGVRPVRHGGATLGVDGGQRLEVLGGGLPQPRPCVGHDLLGPGGAGDHAAHGRLSGEPPERDLEDRDAPLFRERV